MILRHFAANLRRQDWIAIAIELAVVAAGVLIVLQASNWNADRQTDAKAADCNQRLRADLREKAWAYEDQIGYSNNVVANAKRAADALSGKTPLSDEALQIAGYRAQHEINVRRRATYDELTSTGAILEERANNSYRKAFRIGMPHDVQQKFSATCGYSLMLPGDCKGIAHALDYPCSSGLPPQVIATSAAVVHSDPQFLRFLRLRIAEVGINLYNLTIYYPEIRRRLQDCAGESVNPLGELKRRNVKCLDCCIARIESARHRQWARENAFHAYRPAAVQVRDPFPESRAPKA